ncbi:hypothetical protein D3C71_2202510 [compost metagenome]
MVQVVSVSVSLSLSVVWLTHLKLLTEFISRGMAKVLMQVGLKETQKGMERGW